MFLKWILTIAGIYIIRIFFRQSVRIVGIAPIISVALVLAPVNVFIFEIAEFTHLPESLGMIIGLLIILNAAIIYFSSTIIPHFFVENFSVSLTFSACVTALTMLLAHLFKTPFLPGTFL